MQKISKFKRLAEERDIMYFKWIVKFVKKNKKFPTLKEFGDFFNFTKGRSWQIFHRLIDRGYLQKGKSRYWRQGYVINYNLIKLINKK